MATQVLDPKVFDEYQQQLNEWQTQFTQWQKRFLDNWLETLPKDGKEVNFSETFKKTVDIQQEFISNYMEAQQKASKFALESQQKFWDNYFDLVRKTPTPENT
jgi:hypothetical protein